MAVRNVFQAPNEVLNQPAKEVTLREPGLRELLIDMEQTLLLHENPPGVGLAAPQVGVSLQIFVARVGFSNIPKDKLPNKVEVFINPQILKVSGDSFKDKEERKTAEGCLSLKDIYGDVSRGMKVKIKYQTVNLDKLRIQKSGVPSTTNIYGASRIQNLIEEREKIYTGLEARIMQHEVDHLQGTLFTARVLEQQGRLYHVERDEKGREHFVPVEIE